MICKSMGLLFKTYCPETGIVWKECEDMGGQGSQGPEGPSGPPGPQGPSGAPGDLIEYLGDEGGTLPTWGIIAIVNATGESSPVVTLPLALAGVVGMKATVLNVGTSPVLVQTSDTPQVSFDLIAQNDSAVFAPTNNGEVHRLMVVSTVQPEKADVYAQRSDGGAFVPNNDVLTKVELWNATTNVGGHFDGATFVAPRNATYAVSASVFAEWAAWAGGNDVRLCVVKNGTALFTTTWTPPLNGPSSYVPLNVACTVRCVAGDEVWVAMRTTRTGGAVALVASGYQNTLSISEL